MALPLVLVTGFGPFEAIDDNPSARVAEALAARPPAGLDVACAVLPTSFARSAAALDRRLAELAPRAPGLLLALGVQSREGTSFRLERRAARLKPGRPDVDDVDGAEVELPGGERRTTLDLERLGAELASAGAHEVAISDDAGGYVCERIYHHALLAAEARSAPALFLHLPPAAVVAVERQVEVVARFLPMLARAAGLTPGG